MSMRESASGEARVESNQLLVAVSVSRMSFIHLNDCSKSKQILNSEGYLVESSARRFPKGSFQSDGLLSGEQ